MKTLFSTLLTLSLYSSFGADVYLKDITKSGAVHINDYVLGTTNGVNARLLSVSQIVSLVWSNGFGFIRPELLGAVGDDVTDDSAALQAAIDACSVLGSNGLSSVIILNPAKAYYITNSLKVHGYVNMKGNGRGWTGDKLNSTWPSFYNIRFSSSAVNAFVQSPAGNSYGYDGMISGSSFEGIGIKGPGSTVVGTCGFRLVEDGTGIHYSGQSLIIKECNIYNAETGIIENGLDNFRIDNVGIHDCVTGYWNQNLSPASVDQAGSIHQLTVSESTGTSVRIEGGAMVDMRSCDLYQNAGRINLVVANGSVVTYSGNVEGGNPQFYIDNANLRLFPGEYDKATSNGAVITNGGSFYVCSAASMPSTAQIAPYAHGISIVDWTAGGAFIVSEVPLLVTNAHHGRMFLTTPFFMDFGTGRSINPQLELGEIRNFSKQLSPYTYDNIAHSVAIDGVSTNWINWDEFGVNWTMYKVAAYPDVVLSVTNITLAAVVVRTNALSLWPTAPTFVGACAVVSSNGYPYMLLSTNAGTGSLTWTGTNKFGW